MQASKQEKVHVRLTCVREGHMCIARIGRVRLWSGNSKIRLCMTITSTKRLIYKFIIYFLFFVLHGILEFNG